MPKFWKMRALAQGVAEILLFDEIASPDMALGMGIGISAKQFVAELQALGEVSEITLRINSPGGDVYEGLAIYNALKASSATITARIEGMAASVASLIAMAADRIEMPSNAMFLIHEPRFPLVCDGTAADLAKAARDLETMTASFVAAYAEKTKGDPDEIAALMAEDRVMSAAEAKALGFADAITDAVKMTASYQLERLPPKARAVMAAALSHGKAMAKRPNARRARAADDADDNKVSLEDLTKQVQSLAKAVADMQQGDGDDDQQDNAQASDDDGQSDADTDEPNARAADDDGEGQDGDEDVPPPPAARARAAANKPRTFKSGQEHALAYAQQVTETCTLAGFANMATAFIKDRKPMAEIRADLMKARASGKQDTVAGRHSYGGSRGNAAAADAEVTKGWDSAVAKANAVGKPRARRG